MNRIERIDSAGGRRPLHTVAATRRIERRGGADLPSYSLMARAGEATARLALALCPHARHVQVFAGPGHNGGDGIEAATRLREFGKEVSVRLSDASATPPPLVAEALARATGAGVAIEPFDGGEAVGDEPPDLVIDALLGIGASRPPEASMADAIDAIAHLAGRGSRVLALDAPSGLDPDRGQPLGRACVAAHDTLTFLTLKPGLFTASGRDQAGQVWLAGLDVEADDIDPADAWLCGTRDPSVRRSGRRHAQHKGSFGDVAVVGGSAGMTGAAWLAARAAHAAGAGRVFVDTLDSRGATAGLDPLRPELMQRHGWWQGAADVLGAGTVVCGCGGGDAVRQALPRLLSIVPRLLLDADAINALARDRSLQSLASARRTRGMSTILTPHPLEAARLLGSTAAEVQADRLGAARTMADRYGAVVVLKGSGTIVAAPGETPRINVTGNASLASAGTGDVLAGWIGGLWASATDAPNATTAFDVATRGVIEHGAAAEPEPAGPMRAADLIEALHRRCGH